MEARNLRPRDLIHDLDVEFAIRAALGSLDLVADKVVTEDSRVTWYVTEAELALREALGALLTREEL